MRFFVMCDNYREEVIGDLVEIDQAPGEAFAVHRSHIGQISSFPYWTVTHVETGFQVGCGDTIDFAVQMAREKFAAKTPEQIATALARGRAILAEKAGNPIRNGEHYRNYADDEDDPDDDGKWEGIRWT